LVEVPHGKLPEVGEFCFAGAAISKEGCSPQNHPSGAGLIHYEPNQCFVER
jgi:hypothetical protein